MIGQVSSLGAAILVLIYMGSAVGATVVTIQPSGLLTGVLVNNQIPTLHTLTTTGPVITLLGKGVQHRAAYYPVESDVTVLNPNVLGQDVIVCAGEVHTDSTSRFDVPSWCQSSPVVNTEFCEPAFSVQCGQLAVDSVHIWSWSKDGSLLFQRQIPDPVPAAISVSVAVALLASIELSQNFIGAPKWLLLDIAGFALISATLLAKGPFEMLVHGISFGSCMFFRIYDFFHPGHAFYSSKAMLQTVSSSLALAVSSLLPVGAVGVAPRRLLQATVSGALSVTSGSRGTIWVLPWVIFEGLLPVVVQSAAIDVRSHVRTIFVTALFAASLFIIGISAAQRAPWWRIWNQGLMLLLQRRSGYIKSDITEGTSVSNESEIRNYLVSPGRIYSGPPVPNSAPIL